MIKRELHKNFFYLALGAVVLIAFSVRILGYEHITFGYDQARDALESRKILESDPLKIIGPMTDIPGLFHGPLYWYILAPFYHFSDGNPYVAKLALILLNVACIPLLFYVARRITGDKATSLIACLVFALSLESIQYARWMSNPSPAFISTLITWLGFWLMLERDWRGVILFLLSWPFSVQFEFFLVYHLFIFIPLFFARFHVMTFIKTHTRHLLFAVSACVFVLSPFIIGQIKFKFQSLIALSSFLYHKKGDATFTRNPIEFIKLLTQNISLNIVPGPITLSYIVLIVICIAIFFIPRVRRRMYLFLLFWFVSPVIIFMFGHHHSYFLTLGNLYALILMASYILTSVGRTLKQKQGFALITCTLLLFSYFSITRIYALRNDQEFLFSVQKDNNLFSERELIKWIYTDSGEKNFAINTLSNPLLRNTTWSYLFDQYGRKAYGRMPAWKGADQSGVFGEEIQFAKMSPQSGNLLYLIIEPEAGIPIWFYIGYPLFEDRRSHMIEERSFGTYRVQKRIFTNEIGFDYNDLFEFVKRLGDKK